MTTATRYTAAQTKTLIEAYQAADSDDARKAVVVKSATALGKSTQSIISKLSREGVYQKPEKTGKDGKVSVTKTEYVNHIAIMLGVRDVSRIESLEKVSKAALMLISEKLNGMNDRTNLAVEEATKGIK